jgi:hypothetical protein
MMTALEKWQAITQNPEIVGFFTGLFERVGIRVTDPNEEFTCVHLGDRVTFEPGIDRSSVDYAVQIESFQVDRLVENARSGRLDEAEQYRIVSTLFTPATAATLKNPVLSHPLLRRLSGAEDLIHIHLRSPVQGEADVSHTLVYAARQWLVLPGLHGRPRRVYRLALADAIEYQRQVFGAMKENRWSCWFAFSRWYRKWRTGVSTPS